MKEEFRKKEEQYKVYIAEDGTEFEDENQCKLYESTATCVIKSKSKKKSKLLIFRNCEDEIYNIIWQHELIEKINNECKNEEEQKELNSDQL